METLIYLSISGASIHPHLLLYVYLHSRLPFQGPVQPMPVLLMQGLALLLSAGSQYDPVRSVFVGNLAFDLKDEDLIAVFNDASDSVLRDSVEAVRVVRDQKTNIGKGFAFVLFKTKAAARAALDMNEHKFNKRKLRITRVVRNAVSATRIVKKAGADAQDGPKGGKQRANGAGQQGSGKQRFGAARPHSAVKSADWQGVQTKGKGSNKVRGPQQSVKGSSGKPDNRTRGSKRPSLLLRKAQQKAAAGGPPVLQSLKRKVQRAVDQGSVKSKKKPRRDSGQDD